MWKPAVCYQCRIIWIITRPDVSTAEVSSVQEHWVRQASLQIKVFFPPDTIPKEFSWHITSHRLSSLKTPLPWKHIDMHIRHDKPFVRAGWWHKSHKMAAIQGCRCDTLRLSSIYRWIGAQNNKASDNWSQFGTILHSRIRGLPFQRANSHSFVSFKKSKECIRYPIDGENRVTNLFRDLNSCRTALAATVVT